MAKKSVLIYADMLEVIDEMDDNEAAEIIRAIRAYLLGEEYQFENRLAKLAFMPILRIFERDTEKYESIVQKRTEAVNKRWQKVRESKAEPQEEAEEIPTIEIVEEIPPPPKANPIKKDVIEEVKDLWNSTCGSTFGKIQTISVVRSQKLKARIKDFGDDYLARFEEIFQRLNNAPFCIEGAKKWCNFDWIIANDNNYVKLLEGRYDHHSNDNGSRPLTKYELAQLSKQQAATAIANSCVADFEREREKESRVPIMQL